MARLRAVIIYVATADLPRAYGWCAERGYDVAAVVPMGRLSEAWTVVADGDADIIVAASKDALPRIEVADDDG